MNKDLEEVALQFRKLPGIGVKSARRLAYFMLERPQEEVDLFLDTIIPFDIYWLCDFLS